MIDDRSTSPDSLFDEPIASSSLGSVPIASRSTPPISGLYIFPSCLSAEVATRVLNELQQPPLSLCIPEGSALPQTDDESNPSNTATTSSWGISEHDDPSTPSISSDGKERAKSLANQYMFFSPPPPLPCSLPPPLTDLLTALRTQLGQLETLLRPPVYRLLFDQHRARQAILNIYRPGEGISDHVDLPGRYEDGVVGVSLTGGAVMCFRKLRPQRDQLSTRNHHEGGGDGSLREEEEYHVYLPERSVYVLSGEARWDWTHGMDGRQEDEVYVEEESADYVPSPDVGQVQGSQRRTEVLRRGTRVSVTYRYMKQGADVVGPNS